MKTDRTNPRFRSLLALAAAAAVGLLLPLAAKAGPNSDAPPNDPETERLAFKVADGFEVNLFASEPMVMKPIGMNFDSKGRLWVAGSQTYPQVKPGDVPNDKIYILEDTDGDGKADKSTVFAEGLFLATAVEIGDGGVYAANSTEMLHLKDTDGDGKADVKRIVLSGFGTEDTHHVIHGFRWDYGGRLNFLQGIYIGSRVETPRGTKVGLASTLWQLRPEKMELGIYCQGLVNPWGVTWDRYGQMFLTDGAGGEGVNFAPPDAQFTAAYAATRVLKGLNPGSPKYCGAQILDGRHMPDDWQGDLITNDFRANRTVRFKLKEDGSGFSSKLMSEVIVSADRAYRPVDVKMGPDGALYIADWYNPIINHGEVDFRDARRDKVHGRIWRITAKGRLLAPKPKIDGAPIEDLLALLASPEQWTRLQAKLQLRALGGKQVVPALAKWVAELDKRNEDSDELRLEGLWAYETLDNPELNLVKKLLGSKNPGVRSAAVRVMAHWSGQIPTAAAEIGALSIDPTPRVRLEAIRALAEIGAATGNARVVPLALRALEQPTDPVIDFALYQILTQLKETWTPLATAGTLDFADPKQKEYALRTVQSGDILKKVVADLKADKTPTDARKEAYDLVAALGGPADVVVLIEQAAETKLPAEVRASALSALERALKSRKIKPAPAAAGRVAKLLADPSPVVQEAAIRLCGIYKLASAKADLEAKLVDEKATAGVRLAAGQAIGEFGRDGVAILTKHSAATAPPIIRAAAIAGLAAVDLKAAATAAGDYLVNAKPQDDPGPVLGAFLKRDGGIDALATVLKGKKLPADTAKLSLRYVQGVGVDLGQLGEVIRSSAGAAGGQPVQLSADEMKKTVDEVMAKGDPARGEIVYRSKTAGCVQCHMIGGVGGPLAPDLRAIGASAPTDYIIDSILDPAKAVKDGYAATSVTTMDGDLVQGIKVREDTKELVLRDNARDEIVVPIAEIRKRKEGGSLMPVGLQDGLTRQEFIDLVRFLAEVGKPGAYSVPPGPIVRRWRALDPVPEGSVTPPAISEPGWWPVYGTVAGVLPLGDLPTTSSKTSLVAFQFVASDNGSVRLLFNNVKGLSAWLDGKPLPLDSTDVKVDVAKGLRTVTLRVDGTARAGEPIRVETAEVQGSSVHASPVAGR